MTTAQDIQSANPGAIVELYTLDASVQGQGTFHFSPQSNYVGTSIVFGGVTFAALPIDGDGFKKSVSGAAPRPTLTLDNTQKVLQAAVIAAGDLVGAKITRQRVFAKYLDAVNFVGSVNASADTTQILSSELYIIDRKAAHNNKVVQWELVWPIDRPGLYLPRRQVLRDAGFPGVLLNTQ